MNKNRWIKKISIALIVIIAILFVLSSYISYFLNDRLPKIIVEKNDTPYNFTYEQLNFSIFNSSLNLKNISVSPKDSTVINDSIKVTGRVKEINIVGINFLKLISEKEVSAYSINIDSPIVNYYLKENSRNKDTARTKVGDSFDVSRIKIKNGEFNLFSQSGDKRFINVSNFNINFKGVRFNERTVSKKIPFKYSAFDIKLDSMFFEVKDKQLVKSKKVHFSDTTFELKDFTVKPLKMDGKKYIPNNTEADLLDVKTSLLSLTKMDWGFNNEDKLYLKTDVFLLKEPEITIIETDYSRKNDTITNKINFKKGTTDLIDVQRFQIEKGKIKALFSDAKTIKYRINGVNLNIGGIKMNDFTRTNEIPIDYNSFGLKLDSMYYRLNKTHILTASNFNLDKRNLVLKNFKMKPLLSKAQFKSNYTESNILLDIQAPYLKMNNIKWGIRKGDFYFHTNSIKLDKVDVNILEQKNQNIIAKDNTNQGNKNSIDLNLSVDTIKIDQSRVVSDKKFDVKNINIMILGVSNVTNGVLNINDITLRSPIINFYTQTKDNSPKNKNNSTSFNQILNINKFKLLKGQFNLISLENKISNLKLDQVNLSLDKLKVDSKTVKENIPFVYNSIDFSTSGVDYDISKVYKLNTSEISYKNGNLMVNKLKLTPKISRKSYTASLKKQADLYTVSANKIMGNVKFGFSSSNKLFVKSSGITLNELHANIFRSLSPPDDTSRKTMFSEKLRKMQMDLQINQINLVNSVLEYEEETKKTLKTGKLSFTKINAKIKNVNSGFNKKTLPDVIVDWNSEFMKGNLYAKWTFNPMNTSEKFNINGSISNLPAKNLDPFLVPYLKISAEGKFNKIYFNFDGNDKNANGVFRINYNDLKVSLLRESGNKRRFLSAIGNVAIKKDSKGEVREKEVKNVTRKQDKSFFNFFLACILDGLKKALLII